MSEKPHKSHLSRQVTGSESSPLHMLDVFLLAGGYFQSFRAVFLLLSVRVLAALLSVWESHFLYASPHCDIMPLSQWGGTCLRTRRLLDTDFLPDFPPDQFCRTTCVMITVNLLLHNSLNVFVLSQAV